jgi:hypothetical protein
MKKLAVIILVVLVAVVSLAANSAPASGTIPIKDIAGTLRYGGNNICMVRDYISPPVMDNIYLIGKGFPTQGQYRGCHVNATGYFVALQPCRIFLVVRASYNCSATTDPPSLTTPPSLSSSPDQ